MRPTKSFWFAAALAALVAVAGTLPAHAEPLSAAAIRIEINDTDGDAGIQIFVDGEGWDRMWVVDPAGKVVLKVEGKAAVGMQGVTELFLESAEPSFDEQPLDELLALFPEGEYRFLGRSTEGVPLRGSAFLTHALPDGPVIVAPLDGDDEVDPDDTVVEWLPVADPPGSSIIGYQVIVVTEEPRLRVFSADVDADVTMIAVPPEFMTAGEEFKAEVLAIEESGNQTISEAEFETEG